MVYCSFANSERCLGICIIECATDNPLTVSLITHAMGLNPGGELLCMAVPEEELPAEEVAVYRANMGRLIPKEEAVALLEAFGARSIRDHEAAEGAGLS
jgi:hypothetical protein